MIQKQRKMEEIEELIEKVISVNRVAKVVKGGRRFSFSVLVVIGDGQGKVGYGLGKAREVPEAISKALIQAKKTLCEIVLDKETIPHNIIGKFSTSRVLLYPASEGTGVIAGGKIRAILEAVGIKNILTKSMGSSNSHNIVRATIEGLKRLRSKKSNLERRGIHI